MTSALRKPASGARLAAFLFAAIALLVVPASQAQQTERAKELGKKLMCVCGCNQVLTSCNHVGCTYSHTMLKQVDDRVARGDSDQLILQAFVQEYGPTVLAEPPAKGFDWAAWIVPVVVPLVALFILWEVARRWRQRAVLAPAGGPKISAELLDRARHEADKEIDE
ncbi:MAG TPA: cytochrome c-type biogenesis protein CcmH [Candidatus Polarisedimenticolia bacterium]|nr:cytochrome c-type biogenesis protein CcmH [Candidatus Polarisedimenticolia bacterium]